MKRIAALLIGIVAVTSVMSVTAPAYAVGIDEARARADSFRKRTPNSLFLPMVDAAIASIP